MKRPSGSSLHLLHSCVGSHVYPQVFDTGPAAEKGKDAHFALEQLVRANEDIPGFGSTKDYAPEVAFAYDCESGIARVLGVSLGREYGKLAENEIPMTADLLGETPDTVLVIDWKVKNGWEGPARLHSQLRALALAAARCSGKKRGIVSWIKFNPEALPEFEVTWRDSATFDEFDLDCIEDEIRTSFRAWKRAAQDWKDGREPNLAEGSWCRFCPARKSCRAKTAMVRAAISQPVSFVEAIRDLAPEQLGEVYAKCNAAMSQLHALRAEVEAMAHETPVPLPDGRILMLTEGRAVERVTDPRAVAAYLSKVLGPDVALAACDLETSKAAIERALKGTPHISSLKAILSDLREMGAIQKVAGEPKVTAVRPKAKDEAA